MGAQAACESASLQSESQTPTRGQTNATRKQAKGGKRKDRKEERQREGAREKRKGDTGGRRGRRKEQEKEPAALGLVGLPLDIKAC